ncbi:MAG TPA: HipA family kinase [Gemmatimonadales bacterium]|nr:HipA family kinase [Gemmatimonadales bacterium]
MSPTPASTTGFPRVSATRYVQPLREGGSLPAVVDTDGGLFVVKFRGAGQGAKALVAELLVGRIAEALELPVPELALVDVPPPFGRSEPDPEIQDLLRQSHGVNVGLRYLDGAFNFDGKAAGEFITADFAARLVWLDAFVTNPDRTHRNPNLLIWQRQPWLIDHGAALYAHHDWASVTGERVRTSFPLIRDHVLLAQSEAIESADALATARLSDSALRDILGAVPDELLHAADPAAQPGTSRERYRDYMRRRLDPPRAYVTEAIEARARRLREPPQALGARR